jgi:hypothetical protein
MNELTIQLDHPDAAFTPGARIAGKVNWRLEAAPEAMELRLVWYTEGKGTRDGEIVQAIRYDHAAAADSHPFQIIAPDGPHSFSGTLISLLWALELVTDSEDQATRTSIVIAPGAREIELHSA